MRLLIPTLLLAAIALSGCSKTFSNLTTERVPANPSNIYTISYSASVSTSDLVPGSMRSYIVIDGEEHQMTRSSMNSRIFEYEYRMPRGHNYVKYYYILRYLVNTNGVDREREKYSQIYQLQLTNRYVTAMQADRGPVGSIIPVVGRGFDEYDRITVGGVAAETHFASSNSLTFRVPPLPAETSYDVLLNTGQGNLLVGQFRVDAAQLFATPGSIEVTSGQRTMMVIKADTEIPTGGLYVEVTTDIPDSVIMPEIIIPAGSRTVNVPLEGGEPGKGTLFIAADGFKPIEVPITVKAQD